MREFDGGRFRVYLDENASEGEGGARLMACAALFCARMGIPCPGEETLKRAPQGKPYFDVPGAPRFSVSHSGRVWGAAFSPDRIGFDVERMKARDWQSVAGRFFHPAEREMALSGGEAVFFSLWTAKESYVKYLGTGIDEGFSSFCIAVNGKISGDALGVTFSWPPVPEGYFASVCTAAERSLFAHACGAARVMRP